MKLRIKEEEEFDIYEAKTKTQKLATIFIENYLKLFLCRLEFHISHIRKKDR